MILKNNAMTSNNNYDIKITPGFEDMAPSIQSEIYLVFESKTVTPNSTFKICEIQDDSGNNIIIEEFDERPVIKAKLTNQQTKEDNYTCRAKIIQPVLWHSRLLLLFNFY